MVGGDIYDNSRSMKRGQCSLGSTVTILTTSLPNVFAGRGASARGAGVALDSAGVFATQADEKWPRRDGLAEKPIASLGPKRQ